MSVRRLTVLVLSCVAGLLGATPAAHADAPAGSITKTSGTVSATLSWKKGEFAVTSPTLSISRAGVVVSNLDVSDVCKDCLLVKDSTDESTGTVYTILHVVDLNGDGEPEVTFDTYSGGAHCCTTTRIYAYQAASNSYRRVYSQFWGDVGYEFKDLDGDGVSEISGSDDAFAYSFSSYASSAFPPRIFKYTVDAATGKVTLVLVTKKYPAVIKADAAQLLKYIRAAKPDPTHEIQGALAAYAADQYLLGKGSVGKAEIARAKKRKLTAVGFETNLLKFLKQAGYR